MAVVIKIPTWATLNLIPANAPAAGLAILNGALGTSVGAGSENPVWRDLQDLDLGGGPLTRGSGPEDLAVVSAITNTSFLTIGQLQLITALGGEVEGFTAFFEFDTEAELDAEVPASFPGRTWQDASDPDNPVDVVHTWRTWQPNHQIAELGGKFYKSNETSQAALPASVWVNDSSLTPKTVAEYRAIQAANAPAE